MIPMSIPAQAMAISTAPAVATDRDKRVAKLKRYIRVIYETLPERPGGMTRPEIIEATGFACGSVKYALWALQKADLVAGTPKVARDFSKYWRV